MKLLRTIRLDPSDTLVFPAAAEAGEWAVSGTFAFFDAELEAITGRERAAFRSGFLGVPSLAWSTLAQIVEATQEDRAEAVLMLSQCLLDRFGAPAMADARRAAEEEFDFAASLCDGAPGTLIALHRSYEGGAIRESFRRLHPRGGSTPARAFSFVETNQEESAETLDLTALARRGGQ